VVVSSLAELLQISASMNHEHLTETRIRFLANDQVEVVFYFGENSSAMAKALGLTKILVFDYGSTTTFDVDKFDLAPAFQTQLDRQAELLRSSFSGLPVFICGHTDQTGETTHNQQLSFLRAQAVTDYLTTRGVPKGLVKTQGFGSTYPVAGNDTPTGRTLNRRTEIILSQ
jgi:outer membrane protein OmpA-like peptidoglycan-associated protein